MQTTTREQFISQLIAIQTRAIVDHKIKLFGLCVKVQSLVGPFIELLLFFHFAL